MNSIRTGMALCWLLLGTATGCADGALDDDDVDRVAVARLFTHDFAQQWRAGDLLFRPDIRLALVPEGTDSGVVAFRLPDSED